jgi:hypothetical protein
MSEKDFGRFFIDKTAPEPANHAEQTEQKSYFPRFVCPECACETLIEARCPVENTIAAIDEEYQLVYDKSFSHYVAPDEITYRCSECDYVLKDQKGNLVHGVGDLSTWLEEQAKARMAEIKFDCPVCGGHQLDDKVEIDGEGYCHRFFCCHDCGEVVTDEDEDVLREMLDWGRKCVEKHRE